MSLRLLRHVLVSSIALLAAYETASAAPPAQAAGSSAPVVTPGPPVVAAGAPAAPSPSSSGAPSAAPASGVPSAAAPPAAAPPATPPAPLAESLTGMAKAEYAAARILYDDGDFAGALEKLRSTYDMSKDPRLLWNMAACQKNLRHYAEVVRLVDRYLSEGRGYVSDSDRSDATSLLDTVKDFISRVDVTSNEAGAAVFIDDVAAGTTPLSAPLPVDMGNHKVRVSKAGFVDFAAAFELPGGRPFSIKADLVVERHEGKLRVVAEPQDVLQIDGKVVGTGLWEGVLKSGSHSIYVTANGKIARQTEVVIADNQVSSLNVALEDRPVQTAERSGVPAWVWIAGGVLVAGGSVGAYFLLKPHDAGYQSPNEGNWGAISL
jgi:hypothetical protein